VHDTLRLRRTGKGPSAGPFPCTRASRFTGIRSSVCGVSSMTAGSRNVRSGCHQVRTVHGELPFEAEIPLDAGLRICGDDRNEDDAAGRGAIDRSGSTGGAVVQSVSAPLLLNGSYWESRPTAPGLFC
jgi:hypothetical protein